MKITLVPIQVEGEVGEHMKLESQRIDLLKLEFELKRKYEDVCSLIKEREKEATFLEKQLKKFGDEKVRNSGESYSERIMLLRSEIVDMKKCMIKLLAAYNWSKGERRRVEEQLRFLEKSG